MTSGEKGRVVPLLGGLKAKDYVPVESDTSFEEEESRMKGFDLFRFAEEGIERQAVVLYHSNIFDVENETIYCRIKGAPDFIERLRSGEFRFLYYTDEGFLPVENCQVMGNHILIVKDKPNKPVTVEGRQYSVFVIEAREPQKESVTFDAVSFSSAGSPREAEYAGNGTIDYDVNRFYMFGDTLSLFSECYIGMNHYFSKRGSRINIRFHASFEERYVGLSRQEEDADLKVVKRKPRQAAETQVSYAYAEEIAVE